jgi:hypothetical protein
MTRRTLGLLMAVLIWGVSATAMAQTTTSSSSTTSSTSTSTSSTSTSTTSTSTSTTSTTRVNPCAGQPCTADPPAASLSGSGGSVGLPPDGYCWREIAGELTKCLISTRALEVPVGLVVRAGETLTLRFETTLLPREVVLHRENEAGAGTVLTPSNPTTFVADFPVGVYFIGFATKWNQGDVGYGLKIDVRAAPRPLALTG